MKTTCKVPAQAPAITRTRANRSAQALRGISRWLGALTLVLALMPTIASAVHSTVPAPDGTKCVDESTTPWAGGATPSTPGLWANSKRGAVGWDLVYSNDKASLKVILYTYNNLGRPTWLASTMQPIGSDSLGSKWTGRFYKYTSSNSSGVEVGSVAIRFMPDDLTKVAISWDWDELRLVSAPVQQECIHDIVEVPANYFSSDDQTSSTAPVSDGPVPDYAGVRANQLFSGYWNSSGASNPDGVPGFVVNILQNTYPGVGPATQFVEADYLITYDASGEPVWLLADMPTSSAGCTGETNPCSPPPLLNSGTGKLDYVQPLACSATVTTGCYHHSPPTEDCLTICASYPYQNVGTITRNITDGVVGTQGNITATITNTSPANPFNPGAGSQTLGGANAYPPNGVQTAIKKITNTIGIRPVQFVCNARNSAGTCWIYVPWNAGSGTGVPWRHNLNDGSYTSLSASTSGEIMDLLHADDRVTYELWTGTATTRQTLVDQSTEVRALGYSTGSGDSTSGAAANPPAATAFSEPGLDNASDLVGAVAGEFRVDEGGNASYRIPLAVAPGKGGLSPTLALSYNSGAGTGYFGTGFSLEGTSAILPCRPGKEFGDSDAFTSVASVFCLDGQRLLLQSGTDRQVNAVYRTEIETFQKVVIQSVDTLTVSGATLTTFTFKIYGKDGSTRLYGGSAGTIASSCLTCSAGSPLVATAWLQTNLTDVSNNAITYAYSALTNSGERYIDTISYTGGLIKLNYTAGNGVDSSYSNVLVGSTPIQGHLQRSLLARSIDVSSDSDSGLLRHYALQYHDPLSLGNGQIRARLDSISECADANGTLCFPATTLLWSDSALSTQTIGSTTSAVRFDDISSYKFGDFNGDHRSDMLWIDSNHILRVNYSTSTAAGVDFSTAVTIAAMPSNVNSGALWEVMDLNGDGLDDILYAQVSGSTLQWYVRYAQVSGSAFSFGVAQALTGVTASAGSGGGQSGASMLADFDGDGLPDLLFVGPGASSYSIAILVKPSTSGAPYTFASAVPVAFSDLAGNPCNLSSVALGTENSSRSEAMDIDGDGRADVHFVLDSSSPCSAASPGLPTVTMESPSTTTGAPSTPDSPDVLDARAHPFYLKTFKSQGIQGGTFRFQMYNWLNTNITLQDETAGQVYGRLRMLDLNGDGLVDIAYRGDTFSSGDHAWRYMLAGDAPILRCIASCTLQSTEHGDGTSDDHNVIDAQVQLLDMDGDGKVDFWFPSRGSDYHSANPYKIYLWQGNGFASTPAIGGADSGGFTDWMRTAADFDGDGVADSMKIKANGGGWYVERSTSHHTPRNVVTLITNGLGAKTQIAYAPLSFSSVYDRDYNAPWANYGRGSTVFDVASPNTVVQYVSSSAPAYTQPTNTAIVQYFYRGLKVQGGGRGSLGFRRISSFDYQSGMEVDTYYSSQFPTIGLATQTDTRYVSNSFPTDPCSSGNADSAACMAPTPVCSSGLNYVCNDDLPGSLSQRIRLARDTWNWRSQPNNLQNSELIPLGITAVSQTLSPSTSVRANQFVTRTYSMDWSYDLASMAPTTQIITSFDVNAFDDFGNAQASTVTRTGGGVAVTTQSAFTYSNDAANWKLSRLLTSTALNQRSANGTLVYNARRSTFSYDDATLPGDTRKLLRSEKVEGMTGTSLAALTLDASAGAVATYYGYDAAGNKNATYTCSATMSESMCRSISGGSSFYNFHAPLGGHGVTSYSKSDYDSLGRYPNAVHEGFSTGSGNTSIDRITSQVTSRNVGGDALEIVDVNGVDAKIRYGIMGRKRYTWNSAGASSRTDYAVCTGSNCPAGLALAYVATTTTTGSPTTKMFYDILGREALKIVTGFAGESIATMTQYDNRGNPYRKTQPFFAVNATSSASTPAAGSAVYWNRTAFDSLGRPVNMTTPDIGLYTYVYDGLKTTTTSPANGSGQVQTTVQVKDGVGNVISSTDANGFVVSYTYDAYNHVTDVVHGSSTTHTVYDTLGRKTSTTDPDVGGTWHYVVDDAGRTVQQISPRGNCTQTQYDARGRAWQRSDYVNTTCTGTADTVSEWQYDTLSYGVGKLAQEKTTVGGVVKVQRDPVYDSLSRPATLNTSLDGKTYTDQARYDQFGRPFQTLFTAQGMPSTGELYEYNGYGYQSRLRSAFPGTSGIIYYEPSAMDAYGHVTSEYRSSMARMLTERTYDPQTGRLLQIETGGGVTQDLIYTYDKLGNMMSRHDQTASMNYGGGRDLLEMFGYDNLQRLTANTVTSGAIAGPSLTMGYSSEGNITSKSVAGTATATYSYGSAVSSYCSSVPGAVAPGPHAVTLAGTVSHCYDADGNVIQSSDVGRKIVYTPYDLPSTLTTTTNKVGFEYGPNREKIRRLNYASATAPSATDVTHYIGSAEAHWYSTSLRDVRRYIGPLMIVQTPSAPVQRQYFLTDAQGSTFATLTEWGEPVNRGASMSFDPFGARRNGDTGMTMPWSSSLQADLDATTHHGYTGHEQVDNVGVIHMNGRIYDPNLGRFLQADPYVQDPYNSQSLNRYSYVMNNPMAFTDPTGYWGHKQQGYVRLAAAIVITVCTAGAASSAIAAEAWGEAAAISFAGGFAAGAVQSGSGKGALMGGITSLAFLGVNYMYAGNGAALMNEGGKLTEGGYAARALTAGIAGGVLGSIQGQRFGSGFVSAGLGSALNPAISAVGDNTYAQGFMAAIVGGTVSEAAGGKFANGAITAAFQFGVGQAIGQVNEHATQNARIRMAMKAYAAANSKLDSANAVAFEWNIFVFGGITGDAPVPGPVKPIGEVIGIAGYSSDDGGYVAALAAGGVHIGGESNYYAELRGTELTQSGHFEGIALHEIGVGAEIPFVAGAGLSGGSYSTANDGGAFISVNGGALGEHAAIGIGGSINFTEEIMALQAEAINRAFGH